MDVWKAGAYGRGKPEVISNDGKDISVFAPLWVGDLVEFHRVVSKSFRFPKPSVGSYDDPVGDGVNEGVLQDTQCHGTCHQISFIDA